MDARRTFSSPWQFENDDQPLELPVKHGEHTVIIYELHFCDHWRGWTGPHWNFQFESFPYASSLKILQLAESL